MKKILCCLFLILITSACHEEQTHGRPVEYIDFDFTGFTVTRPISRHCLSWTDNCYVYCRTCEPDSYDQEELPTKCIRENMKPPHCVDDDPGKLSICEKMYDRVCN